MAVLTPPGCLGLISCYLVNPCPALGLQSQWFLRARAWHLLPHSLTDWRPRLTPRRSAGHWWSWPCPPPPESSSRMACCLPACSCAPAGAEWHRQGVGFGEAANAASVEGCRVVNNFGGMQVDAAALRPETLLWLGDTHCHRNAMPCPTPPCAHHHRAARRTHHPLHVVGRRVNAKRGLQENAPHLVHHLHGRSRLRQSNAWLRMLMREVIALSQFKTHAAAQPEPPRSSRPDRPRSLRRHPPPVPGGAAGWWRRTACCSPAAPRGAAPHSTTGAAGRPLRWAAAWGLQGREGTQFEWSTCCLQLRAPALAPATHKHVMLHHAALAGMSISKPPAHAARCGREGVPTERQHRAAAAPSRRTCREHAGEEVSQGLRQF